MSTVRRNAAVLVGNGLSIAFNPDLNLQSITEEVMGRIRSADGDDVVVAMREIAERALPQGATGAEDFEMLVGAFGAESHTLGILHSLAELTDPSDEKLLKAIKRVAKFAEQVRDSGISHVLEVIAERSHAYIGEAEHLHSLIESIIGEFDGRVTFGNLNYDTLLLAALLHACQEDLADMGHGWRTVRVTVEDDEDREVQALRRRASDFPSGRRVKSLHLHGSLTYWATRDETIHAKLPKEMLDRNGQWKAIREQSTNVRPVVVLASQRDKAEHVTRYPFRLAYEVFENELGRSDYWLVIGYSFRDTPVNLMLQNEFSERDPKPKVLVVTYGAEPTRRAIEKAFGWGVEDGSSEDWLTINRQGANGAQKSSDWEHFVSA